MLFSSVVLARSRVKAAAVLRREAQDLGQALRAWVGVEVWEHVTNTLLTLLPSAACSHLLALAFSLAFSQHELASRPRTQNLLQRRP